MIYWLEHLGVRQRIPEGETVLGRGGRSALLVDVPSVSREHALFRCWSDRLELTDLGSSNGSFVNGQRVIGSVVLGPGDELRLGGAVLRVAGTELATGDTDPELAPPAPSELGTEPVSSIDVLESLVVGRAAAADPRELAQMITSSVDDLLARSARIGPDQAARIIAVAEIVAGWFPGGELDAWLEACLRRLGGR